MTSKQLTRRPTRKALSDADWEPAGTYHSSSEDSPRDEPVFGSTSTPEPTREDSVVVKVPSSTLERMRAALARIEELANLQPNWDSYSGLGVQPSAALHALRLLAAIFQNDVPPPAIVPTSQGGLQLEWHRGRASLEMEVLPNRKVEVFFLMPSGRTWEGPLANNQWRLETFLGQLMAEEPSPAAT
jgi:hypothetical protein